MTDQTNASLIAEAREAAKRADWYMTGESPLLRALAAALEAAEQERDEARKAAEDHVLDADAVHVRLSAELREVNQERDNWKLSAEESMRAEKRWKDRAVEAERLAEVRRETIREYERENEAWSVRAHTAERQTRAAEAEAEHLHVEDTREIVALTQERNQLAAVVEKVRVRLTTDRDEYDESHVSDALTILDSAPQDVLREHDAKVRAEEREKAAQIADEFSGLTSRKIAALIREQGEEQDRG